MKLKISELKYLKFTIENQIRVNKSVVANDFFSEKVRESAYISTKQGEKIKKKIDEILNQELEIEIKK